jgi:hypothetical protein
VKRLLLPVPPIIEEAFGYSGSLRFVAFYWKSFPFGFFWSDAQSTVTSPHGAVWYSFAQHPRVHPFLEQFNFGSERADAEHWLLLDRIKREFHAGDVSDVADFLKSVTHETLSSECEDFDSQNLSSEDSRVIQAALCAMVGDWLDDN